MEAFEEKFRNCSADMEEIPAGHKARFNAKLAERRKASVRNARFVVWSCISTAAVIAVALTLVINKGITDNDSPARPETAVSNPAYGIYVDYMKKVENMTGQIADMGATLGESEYYILNSAIDNITSENVPLEEQLPEEMDPKERERVLNEYYGEKIEAVRTLVNYAKNSANN
jgi:hypothetical protein